MRDRWLLKKVKITGTVRAFKQSHSCVWIWLDDGTGVVKAAYWPEKGKSGCARQQKIAELLESPLGSVITVNAKLSKYFDRNNKIERLELKIDSIRILATLKQEFTEY